jgi:uncharacterized protein (TIGR02453 family)
MMPRLDSRGIITSNGGRPVARSTVGEFGGFPPAAFQFYAELAESGNNGRSWFDAHRDTYEGAVRVPMEELLDRAAEEFGADGKVFRPNRDVRFSKDKRPYKDHCGAVINFRGGGDEPVFYVQVSADGLLAAAGYHELSRDQLERFRGAVADGRTGGPLVRAVRAARAAGLRVDGQELTRAPRGFAPDHPRIDLLRHKRLTVSRTWPVAGWMHTADAYDRIAEVWRGAAGIGRWFQRHVGAAAESGR